MRVERYASEGGLRVFDDKGREVISRLGREGETRVSFLGLDFDYDKRGDLVFAAFRMTEFVDSQERARPGLSAEFLELLSFLREAEEEIVAKIDLAKGTLLIIFERQNAGSSEAAENYALAAMGKQIAVVVEADGVQIGRVYFLARIEADRGRLNVGVGDSGGVVGMGQSLKVNLGLLEGDFYDQAGLAKIKNFIRGEGF